MKQELLKAKTGTLAFTPYLNNRAAVSSSATVTVYDPGGTAWVTDASCTVNSTTGEITYNLSSTYTATLYENCVADFTYTISSITYYQKILFDIVLTKLAITVVDDDLVQEQADIMDKSESAVGTVASATSSTVVDSNLSRYADDYWNGGSVSVFNTSTGAEQIRTISDFASSTGTVSVSSNWGSTPTTSYNYVLRRGFKLKIEKAFDEMMFDIRSRGFRPALILESSELHVPHVKKSLAIICRDFIREPGDKFATLADEYDKQYKDFIGRVTLQYDQSEGGFIDGSAEKDRDIGSIRMKR